MKIKRKIEKSKNLKLVTELILFNLFYLDFKNKDFDDLDYEEESCESGTGVTLREIRLFTDVSLRTLMRYTKELKDCGALKDVRFSAGGETFIAEYDEHRKPPSQKTSSADAHMQKLYRTTLLMILCLDNDKQIDYYGENREFRFFKTKWEMEDWYYENCPDEIPSYRTMQRDMQVVREALTRIEREENKNLYGRR